MSVINLLHSIRVLDNALNFLFVWKGEQSIGLFSENIGCVWTPKEGTCLCDKIWQRIKAYPLDEHGISQNCSISTFSPFSPREILYDLPSWTRKELDATSLLFFSCKKKEKKKFFSIPFLLCLKNSIKGIAKQKLLENKW